MKFRFLIIFLIVIPTISLQACKSNKKIPTKNLRNIIVVGKVEIIPKLTKVDQRLKRYYDTYFSKQVIKFNSKYKKGMLPSVSRRGERIVTGFNETFIGTIKIEKNLYYIGTSVLLSDNGWITGAHQLQLPGGLEIKLDDGDKAVYIGTYKYYRNEFHDIVKIEMVDEYKTAKRIFSKKYKNIKLRKAIPRIKYNNNLDSEGGV